MRIESKPHLCQSYGNCVAVDPEHFDLDDDGIVVITRETVEEAQVDTVQAAIRSCPVNALLMVESDS